MQNMTICLHLLIPLCQLQFDIRCNLENWLSYAITHHNQAALKISHKDIWSGNIPIKIVLCPTNLFIALASQAVIPT